MPSAREISPFEGLCRSAPPGSRTSGSWPGSSDSTIAAASGSSACSGSRQLWGSLARVAQSTTRRVSSEDRGPMISTPMPFSRWSFSRLEMKVESRRSASEPSSVSSGRRSARSTAM